MPEPDQSDFVVALAKRLCAAYRSTFTPQSFTEILGQLHEEGFENEAECEAWCALAAMIVTHREAAGVDAFLEHVEVRIQ